MYIVWIYGKTVLRHSEQHSYHAELLVLRFSGYREHLLGYWFPGYFTSWDSSCFYILLRDVKFPRCFCAALASALVFLCIFCIFLLPLWWYQPSIFPWSSMNDSDSQQLLHSNPAFVLLLSHVQEEDMMSPCGSWGARAAGMKRFPEVDGGDGHTATWMFLSATSKCLHHSFW